MRKCQCILLICFAVLLLLSCKTKKEIRTASYDCLRTDSVKTESVLTFIDSLVSKSDLKIDEVTVTIFKKDSDSVMTEKKMILRGITFSRRDSSVSATVVAAESVATSSADTHAKNALESRTKPKASALGWFILLSASILIFIPWLISKFKR